MDSAKDALNWAQGFERYTNAKYILDSESWKEAQDKIENGLRERKKRGDHNILYYNIDDNTLWNEYRFLFLCQFLEFKTAEFFYELEGKEKVKSKFISKLKDSKRADPGRANSKENKRILSPASLISDFGFTLGCLIEVLEEETENFNNKIEILKKLRDFNKYRVSFIHHSFNTKRKAENLNLKEVLLNGINSGKEILKLL